MAGHAGRIVLAGEGKPIRLGALISSGGAGGVHRVHDAPAQVAKIYHPHVDHDRYARKLAAMLELTPQLPDLDLGGRRIVQIAWPQALLHDDAGRFLGYVMPAIDVDATRELECVLQERQARRMNLPTGLGAKVTLAANLAAVIAELHRQHHHVVDLKPVNLRFYPDALYMAMLDCDGFSIQGHGERFAAPQITPDYLAPEFHVRALTAAGEHAQDCFALAVVVFQLLNFGIHPFTGRPAHARVPTDLPGRIAGRWYPYGRAPHGSMGPVPTSGHAAMPGEVRALFDRAFTGEASTRPTAREWADLLRGYAERARGQLLVCARDAAHQHFVGAECAACRRDQVLVGAAAAQRAPRPAVMPPRVPAATARPGAGPKPGKAGKQGLSIKQQKRQKKRMAAAMARGAGPAAPTRRPKAPRKPPPPPPTLEPFFVKMLLWMLLAFCMLMLFVAMSRQRP